MDNEQVNYRTIQRIDGKFYATFSDKWYDYPVSVYDESETGSNALKHHLDICRTAGYVVSVVSVEINEMEWTP